MQIMKFVFSVLLLNLATFYSYSQQNNSQLHGNFQIDLQTYNRDSVINAPEVPEKMLMNSYANLLYNSGNFSAGIRYEAYLNTMLGFSPEYNGLGIPYKFIGYKSGDMELTAGNFYEQFGSGMVLRAYEEKGLGYDNALDGFRAKYNFGRGVTVKALVGKQRYYFEKGPGIVRGVDGEINVNEMVKCLAEKSTVIIIGGSFVSKYQQDKDPNYVLPENVGASAARLNISNGPVSLGSEYVYKINDPSSDNSYIYKPGEALLINASYSKKGFGVLLSAKRVDNMSFRSNRNASLIDLNINYLPVLSKSYTYSFLNFYPYATQSNGEIGGGAEIMYKFKKETLLGGKYGTNISINFSRMNDIDRVAPTDTNVVGAPGTLGYRSDFFKPGSEMLYQDFNVEINRKVSKKLNCIFIYQNLVYNSYFLRKVGGTVYSNAGIADILYKIKDNKALHFEIAGLFTKQDMGDWAMLQVEYSVAPRWFVSLADQYNYGNSDKSAQVHYYTGSIVYVKEGNRIQLGYGRQRQGIMCVGGVCRNVPASNGFIVSISSSF